jgi:6-pyruvoyl-tetrahydropterin synthase
MGKLEVSSEKDIIKRYWARLKLNLLGSIKYYGIQVKHHEVVLDDSTLTSYRSLNKKIEQLGQLSIINDDLCSVINFCSTFLETFVLTEDFINGEIEALSGLDTEIAGVFRKIIQDLYGIVLNFYDLNKKKQSCLNNNEENFLSTLEESFFYLKDGCEQIKTRIFILLNQQTNTHFLITTEIWNQCLNEYLKRNGASNRKRGKGKFCGPYINAEPLILNENFFVTYHNFNKALDVLISRSNLDPINAVKAYSIKNFSGRKIKDAIKGLDLKYQLNPGTGSLVSAAKKVSDSKDDDILYPVLVKELKLFLE